MERKPVLFIAASECRSDVEEKYNKWYNEVHVPWVMKYKGIRRASRWKRIGDKTECTKYLTFYEYESKEAADEWERTPEFAAGMKELQETWKDGGLDLRWGIAYEQIQTWEK
jgi:heme-degrading monooxygenase HmoA